LISPRNFFTLQQIAISYGLLRRYAEEKSVLIRPGYRTKQCGQFEVALASVEFHWSPHRAIHQTIDSVRATNSAALPSVVMIG
jgi:hypothetical protein